MYSLARVEWTTPGRSRARNQPRNKPQTRGQLVNLADKHRPRTWSDVVGQDKIVSHLRAQADRGGTGPRVRSDKVGHGDERSEAEHEGFLLRVLLSIKVPWPSSLSLRHFWVAIA